jgi:dCMP deaminase
MLSDENFINIALELASASKCVSKQVGAVIVKDGRILSTGYNGTPAGFTNCCDHWDGKYTEDHHEWSKTYEIHAEMNAIIWAARKGISIEGASGIKRIVYAKEYEHTQSETISKFIKDNGVSIEKLAPKI